MKVFHMSALWGIRLLQLFVAIFIVSFIEPSYVIAQDDVPVIIDKIKDSAGLSPNIEGLSVFNSNVEQSDIKSSDDSVSISAPSASNDSVSNDVYSNGFFDANDLVPQGEMKQKGLVNVNPAIQPASKFIITKQTHKGDEKIVQIVSAERAMALGRFDSALLMLDSLYDRNKYDVRVLMGRAFVLQKVGRFDEAMNMYEELSKLEPDDVDIKVNMLGLMGTRYPAVALRRLLGLYKNNKSNVGVVAQLAILYAKTGDTRSALSYLGVASSIEPENATHIFNMAIIADRAGDKDKATNYYGKALDIDTIYGAGRSIPRDVIYERLAQIR